MRFIFLSPPSPTHILYFTLSGSHHIEQKKEVISHLSITALSRPRLDHWSKPLTHSTPYPLPRMSLGPRLITR